MAFECISILYKKCRNGMKTSIIKTISYHFPKTESDITFRLFQSGTGFFHLEND